MLRHPTLLRLLKLALAAATMSAATAMAQEAYPNKPVRLIAPFAPGGSTDVAARLLAAQLSKSTGQQFIVDNRAGAGGLIGMEAAAKAAPDGYTLVIGSLTTTVLASARSVPLPYRRPTRKSPSPKPTPRQPKRN